MPRKKAATTKGPGGRPTTYRSQYCAEVIKFMGKGKSMRQFAAHLKVPKRTIYEWEKDQPEFSQALKLARELSEAKWMDKLESLMTNRNANAALVKLYFANRFRWHEKADQKSSSEELADALAKLAEKLPG